MKQTLQDLTAVRALLESPEKWTQGVFARDTDSLSVEPDSASAVSWCLIGAIRQVAHNLDDRAPREQAMKRAVSPFVAANIPIVEWNDKDGRTHAEVIGLLDAAIHRVRQPFLFRLLLPPEVLP